MSNLIAYIPVLNQRHLNWLEKHPFSNLFLITQDQAVSLLPRLERNMAAVSTEVMIKILETLRVSRIVTDFAPDDDDPQLVHPIWKDWILPDEDISHLVAEKFLIPAGCSVSFEMIWARWDMVAVQKSQPVIPDVVVSENHLDYQRLQMANAISVFSPDWWRQISSMVFHEDGRVLVSAVNTHMPNEYETYIFGDPRLNVDAGQKGKYVALHSEAGIVALCARNGISSKGKSIYVTTFPCEECAKLIAFAGFKKVFFRDGYSTLNAQEVFNSWGVEIVQVKTPDSA